MKKWSNLVNLVDWDNVQSIYRFGNLLMALLEAGGKRMKGRGDEQKVEMSRKRR